MQREHQERSLLITQNIDGLHADQIRNSNILTIARDPQYYASRHDSDAFTPWVYELHGNAGFMHCSQEEEKCSR